MPRRRRRSSRGIALPLAMVAAVVLWAWFQPWGRPAFAAAAAAAAVIVTARVATASRRRQRRLRYLATINGLLALTPLEFEYEVADLLCALGFTGVTLTGMPGDLQADIVATDPDGLSTIVQCKRYAPHRSVGSPVIQSFVGMARIHHDCDRAMFVTTGTFTAPACDLAETHDIELIDGSTLVAMFNDRAAAFA